jgi:hypothetical protein
MARPQRTPEPAATTAEAGEAPGAGDARRFPDRERWTAGELLVWNMLASAAGRGHVREGARPLTRAAPDRENGC